MNRNMGNEATENAVDVFAHRGGATSVIGGFKGRRARGRRRRTMVVNAPVTLPVSHP
ncbi:hypothetical protein [Phytoactinopolyspora endophytica]|uniref:hypothetical protein n=1 Tax=Phytoactinopolyspora endophytica TaxID=1642495 RepID=UPI0013ECA874|nr:hypothetical protein [Phytoactinopolyspora endophytica]